MSENTFYQYMIYLCEKYNGSISSMHRTISHNAKVGGAVNSQHLGYKAADLVCDSWDKKDEIILEIKRKGLFILDEQDHLHIDDRYNSEAH